MEVEDDNEYACVRSGGSSVTGKFLSRTIGLHNADCVAQFKVAVLQWPPRRAAGITLT